MHDEILLWWIINYMIWCWSFLWLKFYDWVCLYNKIICRIVWDDFIVCFFLSNYFCIWKTLIKKLSKNKKIKIKISIKLSEEWGVFGIHDKNSLY